ncbi:MAG: FtsK/SpoIIIE domain-containing protein [Actinomycetes bacterium]
MHVVVSTGVGEREVTLRVSPGATVADVLAAMGDLGVVGSVDQPAPAEADGLDVDGTYAARDTRLDELAIAEGAVLAPARSHGPPDLPGRGPDRWLTVVAGRVAGLRLPLPSGTHRLGRAPGLPLQVDDDTVSHEHLEVTVDAGGGVRAVDLGSSNGTWTAAGAVPAGIRVDLAVGDHLRLGALVLRLDGPDPDDRPAGRLRAGGAGTVAFNRPPRAALPAPPPALTPPGPAPEPEKARPFSVAALLAPIALAGAMVLIYDSWRFALFGLLTPVMAIANHLSARRQAKRDTSAAARAHADAVARSLRELDAARATHRARAEVLLPDPGEVLRRATAPSTALWARRPGDGDHLRLRVGSGPAPVDLAVDPPREGTADELVGPLEAARTLRLGPVAADLSAGGVVGIVGDRAAALGLARQLVCAAATLHGPADLPTVLAGPEDAWAWARWLPHLRDAGGQRRWIAPDPTEAERLLAPVLDAAAEDRRPSAFGMRGQEQRGPTRLLVLDGPELWEGRGAAVRRVLAGEAGPVAGIVVAPTADRLPAACTTVVTVASDLGDATVRLPQQGVTIPDVLVAQLTERRARTCARALARFEDPELHVAGGELPDAVRLTSLLGLDTPAPTGEAVLSTWRAGGRDPAPAAPVGVGPDGPVVVDLRADGPHGLVGGTTGSGKSELLRSLVAGLAARVDPDHLVFVLVDYKGGSAFDRCAALPHTVGMVTDLDAHLGERALVSLEAELHHRETVLRAAGAPDLPAYLAAGAPRGPLPRLVVVIDEFATLAAELPDFLGALVGIAQRGRSLGVHLVLATQRPSGSVTPDIRANTNLRIALRVQDPGDSNDVIDRPDAAELSRDRPGRAYLRRGHGDVVLLQSALSTAPAGGPAGPPVTFGPFPFAAGDPAPTAGAGGAEGPSDLDLLVDACRDAAEAGGYAAPRRPWLEMLPERLDLADARAEAGAGAAADAAADAAAPGAGGRLAPVLLGLADAPDEQRRVPWTFDPAQGHLGITGALGSGTTTALLTVARGLVEAAGPDRVHLYAVDLGGGALAPLADLPHVGAVVGAADREAQVRLVRTLLEEVDRRRALPPHERATAALTVVLVDNLPAWVAAHDDPAGADTQDGIRRLLAEGADVGVVFVVTADRAGAVPHRLASTLGQRLLLRHTDPSEFAAIGVRPAALPAFVPGRGIAAGSQRVVQVALPGDPGEWAPVPADPAAADPAAAPRRVGTLPATVRAEDLPPAQAGPPLLLPVGIAEADLAPAVLPVHPGEHVLVAGPARSGRSSALVTLAAAWRAAVPDVVVVGVCDEHRSPLWAHPVLDACGSLDSLADLAAHARAGERPWLWLVDDAVQVEDVTVDGVGVLEGLCRDAPAGVHVVAAARADDARSAFGHWTRTLRRSRLGLLLQPDLSVDGEVLGTRLPRRVAVPMVAGRGFLVAGGEASLVQVAQPPVDPPRGSLGTGG